MSSLNHSFDILHIYKTYSSKYLSISGQEFHHLLDKYFIYPRSSTSVNITNIPFSLQTDKFYPPNTNESCHCPVDTSNHKYLKQPFPANIYQNGWQSHHKIGYPPNFNNSQQTKSIFCSNLLTSGYNKCFARIIGDRLNFQVFTPQKWYTQLGKNH